MKDIAFQREQSYSLVFGQPIMTKRSGLILGILDLNDSWMIKGSYYQWTISYANREYFPFVKSCYKRVVCSTVVNSSENMLGDLADAMLLLYL